MSIMEFHWQQCWSMLEIYWQMSDICLEYSITDATWNRHCFIINNETWCRCLRSVGRWSMCLEEWITNATRDSPIVYDWHELMKESNKHFNGKLLVVHKTNGIILIIAQQKQKISSFISHGLVL